MWMVIVPTCAEEPSGAAFAIKNGSDHSSGGGRYFWMGEQTFSKGRYTAWAPNSEGHYPIFFFFFDAVFTDIGAF